MPKKSVRGPSRPLQVTYKQIALLAGLTERTAREYARSRYDSDDLESTVAFINRCRRKRGRAPLGAVEEIDD